MSEQPPELPERSTPVGAPQPAAASAADLAQIAAVLSAMQAQLDAVAARVEVLPTTQDLAEVSQQLVTLQEQAEQAAAQAERAGRPEQAAEARTRSQRAVALLLVLAGATADALWQAFIQEEIYGPLAAKVCVLLEQAGKLTVGPPSVPPAVPPQALPIPPPATPAPKRTGPTVIKRASIEFDWVTVPAGEFLMGSNRRVDKDAHDDEMPQHRVYLPAYPIARVPVTNRQFSQFVQATRYETRAEARGSEHCWYQPQGKGSALTRAKADHPVVRVSWHDAVAFCRWANVGLPSEAEWEKAARGTDGRLYPWGNPPPDQHLCNFGGHRGETTPVGAYPAGASRYGVLDMVGNVWEWTRSLKRPYPYDARDGREDQHAADTFERVLRGGSWLDIQRYARCAYRGWYGPDYFLNNFGFRVVVSLSSSGS